MRFWVSVLVPCDGNNTNAKGIALLLFRGYTDATQACLKH